MAHKALICTLKYRVQTELDPQSRLDLVRSAKVQAEATKQSSTNLKEQSETAGGKVNLTRWREQVLEYTKRGETEVYKHKLDRI